MINPPPIPVASDPSMAYKPKQHPYKFAKQAMPIFAFLLSSFFYISIFCIIFNLSLSTLFFNNRFWFCISNTLILIIAADNGVFSSKHKVLDHYYEQYKQPQIINIKEITIPKEEIKESVVSEIPEDKFQITGDEQTKIPARIYRRSKSEKAKRSSRIPTLRKWETVKHVENCREENELWKMTDEELNKRVEEFIQRFNRQIRLQAAASKTNFPD